MELEGLREEIDRVDDALLPLFLKRMDLSAAIAGLKAENGMPIRDRQREREILRSVSERSGDKAEYARLLYNDILAYSRSYQRDRTVPDPEEDLPRETDEMFPRAASVACQGVEGAYSQSAADRVFPFADITYMRTFEGVFQAVESGLCRFGVLPIENSAHGSVTQVYDLMKSHRFFIVRSVRLHISHDLMVLPGTRLEDIRAVTSHEQAIGQCSRFLASLPDVKVRLSENTAVAARLVAESGDRTLAAISQEDCASLYGLEILRRAVQNTDNNHTRFIVIEKQPRVYPGASRISMQFSTPHTPGALAGVMSRFSAMGLNLTKLESRPVEGSDFHYLFYVDLEASLRDPAVRRMLHSLKKDLPLFTFLGSYQEV